MSYPFDSNQSGLIPQWGDGSLQPEGQLALEEECELSQYGQIPRSILDLNSGSFPSLSHSPPHGVQGHSAFASSASYTDDDYPSGGHYGDWRGGASSHVAPIRVGYPAIPSQNCSLNSDYPLLTDSYSRDYSAPFPPTSHSQDPLTGSSFYSPVFAQNRFLAHSRVSDNDGQSKNAASSHLEQQFSHLQFSASSAQENPSLVEGMQPIPGCSYSLSSLGQNIDELNPSTLFPERQSGAYGYSLPLVSGEDQSNENLGLTKDGRPRKRRPKQSLVHLSEEEKMAHEREVNSGSTARYRRKKIQQRETLEQQLQLETERNEKLHQEYDSLLMQKQQYGPSGFPPK